MPIGAMVGVSAVGIGLQAYGQHKAGQAAEDVGKAKQRAAESEAQLADFNASVAELQAKDALDRGDLEAAQFRSQVRGAIGSTRATQAAGNVDVNFGSTVDVQADEAFLGKLDEMTIRSNAVRQAWGYTVQSLNYRQQARIARETGEADLEAGRASATAGDLAAVGTIATGAGSLMAQKYGFSKKAS
jgi:hypothetical protein